MKKMLKVLFILLISILIFGYFLIIKAPILMILIWGIGIIFLIETYDWYNVAEDDCILLQVKNQKVVRTGKFLISSNSKEVVQIKLPPAMFNVNIKKTAGRETLKLKFFFLVITPFDFQEVYVRTQENRDIQQWIKKGVEEHFVGNLSLIDVEERIKKLKAICFLHNVELIAYKVKIQNGRLTYKEFGML